MIGVIANPSEHVVVQEFFELFKTPWEFYKAGRHYEIILCSGDLKCQECTAPIVLIYGGRRLLVDTVTGIEDTVRPAKSSRVVYQGLRIPLYRESVTFGPEDNVVTQTEMCGAEDPHRRTVVHAIRIGYDLFEEVRHLLTKGQPVSNAGIPTLDLHIALLRKLILDCGSRLYEIPPVPAGYRLVVCLTHDIDHPAIRLHKCDHTMFGFLYRAIVGSTLAVLRGRMCLADLFANWSAAVRLPFVYLGLAKDFWSDFGAYLKVEDGLPSSFFVIPYKGRPGRVHAGSAPARRAAQYSIHDIEPQIKALRLVGSEVGLHGIDAWRDISAAREELEEVRRITRAQDLGVRMHWLYFDERSPAVLDEAGADFDSSVGYNQTLGYRAGTTQVYKPPSASRLLELPLHVMDTALFYPMYLNLSSAEAGQRIQQVVDHAAQFGGVVTINWHDRSLSPERLWGSAYVGLLDELKKQGAWFATASQAVNWFRKRRAAVFENVEDGLVQDRARIDDEETPELPDLLLRFHDGTNLQHDITIVPTKPAVALT